MKLIFSALIVMVLTSINSAYSMQSQAMHGGTGLGMMRTSEVVDAESSLWYMNTQINSYDSTITAGDKAALIKMDLGYIMSLSPSTELGLSFPVTYYTPDTISGESNTGSGDLRGVLKYNFLKPIGANSSGYSVTLFSNLVTSQGDVSSGETLYGAELNVSHYFSSDALHVNFGIKHDDVFKGTLNTAFVAQDLFTASLGLESEISNTTILSLQGLAEVNIDNNDENLLI